jgi:hypothetical protein
VGRPFKNGNRPRVGNPALFPEDLAERGFAGKNLFDENDAAARPGEAVPASHKFFYCQTHVTATA